MERTVDTRDDAGLLRLIAIQRDSDAFSELFGRYKRPGFSLAYSILGDSKAAEEVVQEAMIRVWSSAGKFRNDGAEGASNPKGWIMKIIARESSRALQQKRRRSKEIRQDIDLPSPVADDVTSGELVQALRDKVAALAEEDRQLIALHFGGGLSQTEISEALSVSQQTISLRIQRLLKELRTGLAASGFTCATAGLAANLQSVLSSGYAPSSGLHAKVMARLSARPSVRKPRRTAPPKGANPYGFAAAGVLAGAAVIAIVCLPGSKKVEAKAIPETPIAIAEPVRIDPPAPAPKIYRWKFDKPACDDLQIGRGEWKWIPEEKAMLIGDDCVVGFANVKLPEGPAVFTTKGELPPPASQVTQGTILFHNFIKNDRLKTTGHWGTRATDMTTRSVESTTYVIGRYVVECLNGKPVRVVRHAEEHANAELVFMVSNMLVREIELRPIDLKDVPAEIRDPARLTRDMIDTDSLSPEELKKLQSGG